MNRKRPPVIRKGHINLFAQSDVTCYIIQGADGDLLVDTGFFNVKRELLKWISEYNVRYVFLTHAHPDHDWNAAKIQQTGAKLMLHEADKLLRRDFRMQRVMPTANRWRLRNVMQNVGGAMFKSPRYEPDIWFSDSDSELLKKYGFDAEIIRLSGHTYGSSAILHKNVLYCGDAFTALFGKPDITPHAVSPLMMRKSLKKILELQPEWLACGHGLPLRMRDAAPVIRAYLQTYEKGNDHAQ